MPDFENNSLKNQLYSVKRKMRQAKKVTLSLPNEFTFNRGGSKYFEPVINWFDWSLEGRPVEIDFTGCASANYQALSLLVPYLWKLKQRNCAISFRLDDELKSASKVWKNMGAPGLFAVTTDPQVNFKYNERKPLFAIRNADDFKVALASADQYASGYGVEYQKTLRYVLSELLYNVLEHGRSDFFWRKRRFPTPSMLQFAWYEGINELHFIVADLGIGVKAHLSQAYPGLLSDEEAIRLAIQPEVSGTFGAQDPYTSRNNAGMGLYLSSSITRKLRADMHIVSGNGMLHVSPIDTTSKTLDGNWPGSFVLFTLRLDRANEIALDSMMHEFQRKAREEVASRKSADDEGRFYLNAYNYFGTYADTKIEAINYRDRKLLKAVDEGKSIIIDFQGVESSPHSFLNALLASPIRRMGILAYKRIKIINAKPEIRETIDYIFDDNTGDGASEERYD